MADSGPNGQEALSASFPAGMFPAVDQNGGNKIDDMQISELSDPVLAGISGVPLMMDGLDGMAMQGVHITGDLNPRLPQRFDIPQIQNQKADYPIPVETLNGAGAGPLPTGFYEGHGQSGGAGGGSTLTEFTKRRDWSRRVIDELQDFLHILTPNGKIVYASPSAKALTGYEPEELLQKFIIDFIHIDDNPLYIREFNEAISTGNLMRIYYRFKKADGTYTVFESHGHPHLASPEAAPFHASAAQKCRGFFIISRPYPTRNAALLDCFLEHKIENERLTKRIAAAKAEEALEAKGSPVAASRRDMAQISTASSLTYDPSISSALTGSVATGRSMLPPTKPSVLNNALTRKNLDRIDNSPTTKEEHINEKMARYEGSPSHIDKIEMLTGLQYRDGERAKGISTGDESPTLTRADAASIPLTEKEKNAGDKKKKLKFAEEYVCTDCGTLDSPEWRKGPKGPKSLCNACGRKLNSVINIERVLTIPSSMGQEREKENLCGPQTLRPPSDQPVLHDVDLIERNADLLNFYASSRLGSI
jgi:PAS domain S-box-containing protein